MERSSEPGEAAECGMIRRAARTPAKLELASAATRPNEKLDIAAQVDAEPGGEALASAGSEQRWRTSGKAAATAPDDEVADEVLDGDDAAVDLGLEGRTVAAQAPGGELPSAQREAPTEAPFTKVDVRRRRNVAAVRERKGGGWWCGGHEGPWRERGRGGRCHWWYRPGQGGRARPRGAAA